MLTRYNIAILSIILFLVSCGKQSIEGDKHPDIPEFPNHTNNNLQISPFVNLYQLNVSNHYFFGSVNEKKEIRNLYLTKIYDKKFNLVKEINETYESHIISETMENGTLYGVKHETYNHTHEKITEVFQYKSPLFNKEKIQLKNFHTDVSIPSYSEIYQENKELIDDKSKNISFNKDKFIKQLLDNKTKKYKDKLSKDVGKLSTNLTCIKKLEGDVYILRYSNKTIAIKMGIYNYPNIHKTTKFKDKNCIPEERDITKYKRTPNSFDKAVMGNSWSGNHMVGGFTPHGYDYINLTLGTETTKTKAKNSDGNPGLYIVFESDNKLLLDDKHGALYTLTTIK